VQPDGANLPSERSNHFTDDIEEDAELPLNQRAGYRGGGGNAITEPIGPLYYHLIPQFGDDSAGGEQRGLRSAH
jgi:hypothetical protein